MPDIEPITRAEKLLLGEDLEPLTRLEYFMKIAGEGGGGEGGGGVCLQIDYVGGAITPSIVGEGEMTIKGVNDYILTAVNEGKSVSVNLGAAGNNSRFPAYITNNGTAVTVNVEQIATGDSLLVVIPFMFNPGQSDFDPWTFTMGSPFQYYIGSELPSHPAEYAGRVLRVSQYGGSLEWDLPSEYIRFEWSEDNGSWDIYAYSSTDFSSIASLIGNNNDKSIIIRHNFYEGNNFFAAEGTVYTYQDAYAVDHIVSMAFIPAVNSLKVYKVDGYYDDNAGENVYTTAINTIAIS